MKSAERVIWLAVIGLGVWMAWAQADELGISPAPQYDLTIPKPAQDVVEAFQAGGIAGAVGQILGGRAVCEFSAMSERQRRRALRKGLPRRCVREYEDRVSERFERAQERLRDQR